MLSKFCLFGIMPLIASELLSLSLSSVDADLQGSKKCSIMHCSMPPLLVNDLSIYIFTSEFSCESMLKHYC